MRVSIPTERSSSHFTPRGTAARSGYAVANGECALCGSTAVDVDEVGAPERLALHECRRCEHRWTRTLRPAKPRVAARPVRRTAAAHPADTAEVAIAS